MTTKQKSKKLVLLVREKTKKEPIWIVDDARSLAASINPETVGVPLDEAAQKIVDIVTMLRRVQAAA